MFSIDRWSEIFETIRRNRLRTALTAFAVAWGIYMLVVLLGMSTGLRAGVEARFADDATNSVWLFAGSMSRAWDGLPVGRRVVFRNDDMQRVETMPGVDKLAARFFSGGNRWSNNMVVRNGPETASYDIRATNPDHQYLEKTIITSGRFLSERDLAEKRKVVVIGDPVARRMFRREDPLGQWLSLGGIPFLVVGTFTDEGDAGETERAYIPVTTAQTIFGGADFLHSLLFTVGDQTVEQSKALADDVRATLAARHRFSPDDKQAVRVRNNLEEYESFLQIFRMIDWFLVGIAVCVLFAGAIGVSNIMMIAVKERTREIGLRKALGARPLHIVGDIVHESVFLTSAAGYVGLIGGVGTLALFDFVTNKLAPDNDMFANPSIRLPTALGALAFLTVVGFLAGLFPALSAAKISPIEALRNEA